VAFSPASSYTVRPASDIKRRRRRSNSARHPAYVKLTS